MTAKERIQQLLNNGEFKDGVAQELQTFPDDELNHAMVIRCHVGIHDLIKVKPEFNIRFSWVRDNGRGAWFIFKSDVPAGYFYIGAVMGKAQMQPITADEY